MRKLNPVFLYITPDPCAEMFSKFGLVAPGVMPAILRYFYCSLTGDSSSAKYSSEAQIDSRVLEVISMEPEIVKLCLTFVKREVLKVQQSLTCSGKKLKNT